MKPSWKPETTLPELDERMETAFKRVSGIVGFQLGRDRTNLDALRGTAENILNVNFSSSGPFFMRAGQSIAEAGGYRPKAQLSLKELAADLLTEFYNEAFAAFQAAKIKLHNSASEFLSENQIGEEARAAILDGADKAFMEPSREEMTLAAMPYVKTMATPGTWACIGLVAGMALMLVTLRHPLFVAVGGVAVSGLIYYFARKGMRTKALTLLNQLPQDIYSIFKQNLIANETRYRELVNSAVPDSDSTRH